MKRPLARSFGPSLTFVVALGVLTGCGSLAPIPVAKGHSADVSPQPAPRGQAMSGMVMPGATADTDLTKPTETQALVCGAEIRDTVKQVLTLASRPAVRSTFGGNLYTCSYALPVGTMRLSVQHSANKMTATAYLDAQSKATGAEQTLAGLGERAKGSGDGIVFVLKDNEVLEVDTTLLPKVFGTEQQKRSDLAYEIASDVLGCWTEDDS
jgi:hypothetical protein